MDYGKYVDTYLRDVPVEVFEQYKYRLTKKWCKRAEHYFSEVERTRKGVECSKNGELESYSELCFESS